MKLLIVEDDETQIQIYKDAIESFNKKSHIQITLEIKINLDDAKKTLLGSGFDGAIIDLKLSSDPTRLDGLQIIDEIERSHRFPIYVVSGNIAQVAQEQNVFFQKRNRDADFKKIYAEFVTLYETGITKILGRSGQIEQYLTKIFWGHLLTSMGSWMNEDNLNLIEKQKSLLRHTISHIQEYIDEEIDEYHPSEFYITPPIKKNIHTGDIVKYNNKRYLVLTPSCDIILRKTGNGNAKLILFCEISDLHIIDGFNSLDLDTGKNNQNRKRLYSYIENKKQNFHFIPKSNHINAGLINFQSTLTMDLNDGNGSSKADIERIATIAMPFLKDIISRYTSYFARQGSPDFNSDNVYTAIFEQDSEII